MGRQWRAALATWQLTFGVLFTVSGRDTASDRASCGQLVALLVKRSRLRFIVGDPLAETL